MKNSIKILLFAVVFLSLNKNYSQTCSLENSKNISLNGWDISRTDYTHQKFIEITNLSNYEYNPSTPEVIDEFGYAWYGYSFADDSAISFRARSTNENDISLFNFYIESNNNLNVNGICIGSSKEELFNEFGVNSFCSITKSGKNIYYFNLFNGVLSFYMKDDIVRRIVYNNPL